MTLSITKRSADNGGPDTSTAAQSAERLRGLDRFREGECYHLTEVVLAALREAERAIQEINDMARPRYLDYQGENGSVPMDPAKVRNLFADAYECAEVGMTYIDMAADQWPEEIPEMPH